MPEPRDRPTLVGCEGKAARQPAGQLLARIPWDGRPLDPARVSAERFLRSLKG